MSTSLPAGPERVEYPFAIGVRPDGQDREFIRFNTMQAAALYADLCSTENVTVTRWVAVVEEILADVPYPGWRRVTWFNTEEGERDG